jgi:antitoxin component of MazEF toxin-antitoxin module
MTRVKARDKQKVDIKLNDPRAGNSKRIPIPLKDLLDKVTPENIHKEEFAGGAVGKEIW